MRQLTAALLISSFLTTSGAAATSSYLDELTASARARNQAEREAMKPSPDQGATLLARASALQKGLLADPNQVFGTPDLAGAREALEQALKIEGPHWTDAAVKLAGILIEDRSRPDGLPRGVELLQSAAGRRDRAALTQLGRMHLAGVHVPADRARAQALFSDALAAGDPEAAFELARLQPPNSPAARSYAAQGVYLFRVRSLSSSSASRALARLYLTGDNVPADPAAAEQLFRRAAELGDSDALVEFAELIMEGKRGDRPVAFTRSLLETAAANGSIRAAQLLVHDAFFAKRLDVPQADAQALADHLDRAADLKGRFYLYVALSLGSGIARDPDRANQVVGRLVTAGRSDPASLLSLGRELRDGEGVPQRPNLALPLFLAAAEQQNADAMHDFAAIVLRNPNRDVALQNRALEFLDKAVQSDNLRSLVLMGDAYRHGWGVRQSLARAGELYDRAIQIGDLPAALERRGEILLRSNGGQAAARRAEQLFLRAADKGSTAAMLQLGRLYLSGRNLPKDPDRGISWLEKAQAAGDMDALVALAEHFSAYPPQSPQRRRVVELYEKAWNGGSLEASVPYANLLQERGQRNAALSVLAKADARGHIPASVAYIAAIGSAGDVRSANDRISDVVRDLAGSKEDLTKFAARLLTEAKAPELRDRAAALLARLADEGQASAAATLAAAYRVGDAQTKDAGLAEVYGRRAAELGAVEELFELSFAMLKGYGVPAQPAKAAFLLEEIHRTSPNHVRTLLTLAEILREGHGAPQDVHRAVDLLRAATREGSASAALALANAYLTGSGVPQDPTEAKSWLEAAVGGGSLEAMLVLARSLVSGEGAMLDPERSFSLYRRAAELGSPEATIAVGRALMSGFGVVQDPKAGLRWIEQAASEGHIEAMYDLYQYHVNRPGGEKDALQWIRRAADAGSGDARFRIALLHRDGNLLPQSDDEMMRWLGSAAEAGHEYSVELLGRVKRVGSADILKPHALVQEEK